MRFRDVVLSALLGASAALALVGLGVVWAWLERAH